MEPFELVMRIAHILAAITLAGGTFYQCAVLAPALGAIPPQDRSRLQEDLRPTWSRLVMVSALFLIVSGFYNYFMTIRLDRQGTIELPAFYHGVMGIKMLLAFVIFFLASILSGRSPASARFREQAPRWLSVCSLLAVVVVVLAGVLKVADRLPQVTGLASDQFDSQTLR